MWKVASHKGNKPIVTLVTGFWDIIQEDVPSSSHPVSFYLRNFEKQLETTSNFIIFGDKQLEEFVWNRRDKNNNNTLFIVKDKS